ncbi:hypothetical protein BV210_00050 [Halorientalis sp. IM1011]|nr:hypothetical protein BV210_00050 [Halorientalis sp. IM1011]
MVETDLGEYVIQIAGRSTVPPDRAGDAPLARGHRRAVQQRVRPRGGPHRRPQRTHRVRPRRVGEHIREADVGMTGANFVVAESGTLMLVTNEGNARKTAVTPDPHVAVAGIEKLVPSLADLQPFTELIAKTGTGQDITSYVSLLSPPVDSPIPDLRGRRDAAGRRAGVPPRPAGQRPDGDARGRRPPGDAVLHPVWGLLERLLELPGGRRPRLRRGDLHRRHRHRLGGRGPRLQSADEMTTSVPAVRAVNRSVRSRSTSRGSTRSSAIGSTARPRETSSTSSSRG